MATTVFPRISARKGAIVRLDMDFYANGILTDPYAFRQIDIYQNSKSTDNLLVSVEIPDPDESDYPSPIEQVVDPDTEEVIPGRYYYDFLVPDDVEVPDSFIDVWSFVGDELAGSDFDLTDESLWDESCGKFFIIASNVWTGDDNLLTVRFGFEPLDLNFTKPEIRQLEVGIMPLPLYDYDWNKIVPLIPHLQATISIETLNGEIVLDAGAMELALRQGSHRTNPFVARRLIDTGTFQIGTYKYYVSLALPNGETRVSQKLHLSIQ